MKLTDTARRRAELHAKLVRDTAKIVGATRDPDAFDKAFRQLSRAAADIGRALAS